MKVALAQLKKQKVPSQMMTMKHLRFLIRNKVVFGVMIMVYFLIFSRRLLADTNIADIVFTSSNVLKQLRNLKVNSYARADRLKPILIRILPSVWPTS